MTEQEFAEALGMASFNTSILTFETAITWLCLALEKLMPAQEDADLRGKTVLAWDGGGMVLQDPDGHLYSVLVNDYNDHCSLEIDQHSREILRSLREEGILDQFVNPIAAAEYLRLREGRSL